MSSDHPQPDDVSRVSLAIITEPAHANAFGRIHGGVILRLADECGAVAALRHAGSGQITTAALDSMTFLSPVLVGERVELTAEVTFVGRTSIEARIEVHAEPTRPRRTQAGGRRIWAVCLARCPGETPGGPSPALRERGGPGATGGPDRPEVGGFAG